MPSLNLSSIFSLSSHTQNYHPTSLRKKIKVWQVCPTTLLKLPQDWITCIEKGGPNKLSSNYHNIVSAGQSVLEKLLIDKKNNNNEIPETEVLPGINMNFIIRFLLGE